MAATIRGRSRYTKFTDDSAQDKAVKNMDLENKGKDKTTAESDLVTTKSDLDATQKELDAALAYYEKLKPSCVDAGLSYDERVPLPAPRFRLRPSAASCSSLDMCFVL